MTCPAPSERTSSTLPVLQTPVTSAPIDTATCTANEPTPPLAPLTSTRCPDFTAPTSRIPRRAVVAAMGSAAACSNVRLAGFGTTWSCAAHAYSAKAPRTNPNTSSPGCSPRTSAPTASTSPAASLPTTGIFGLVSPIPMRRATYGSPRRMCQSAGLRAAAWIRTSTSSGRTSGASMSTIRSVSGVPKRSWVIAFIGCLQPRIVGLLNRPGSARACHRVVGDSSSSKARQLTTSETSWSCRSSVSCAGCTRSRSG